ncbi:tetratricopeptide repeat protein [Streptomyces sp. NPDC059378]|uniref:tetratricopeptide repeat protein n=1 Tax=Streptomyces sp. NPDC059378 TaxID=3346815 RepID=UPI00367EE115
MDGQPPTSVTSSRRPGSAGRVVRRLLLVAAVVCTTLGATLLLLPTATTTRRPAVVHPAPALGAQVYGARALAAVRGGVPAALPDLRALIGQRETYLRAHPKDGATWAVLGAAYVQRGRRTAEVAFYPLAEKALRTSLSTLPKGNTEALDGLAALANARRDFPAARKWGETALKQEPKRWTTYPLLIDAYTGLGDYKKARSTLDRLMALHKGPATLAEAAAVYRDRGWREDAAATLTDAAAGARSPAEQAAYQEQAGQLAWERGDTAEALRHFEEAVRLDRDQWAARAGQGRVLAALGRTTEAVAAYRAALAGQPLPQYALELGELYESLGLAQKAQKQYDLVRARVGAAAAGGADEELVLGLFEADHGDPDAAVRRLRAEWRRQPGIAVADALGWALHRTGQDEEALKFAGTATDKVHGGGVRSALYAYHRGVIEQHLDRKASARRHLEDALRINPDFSLLGAPAARAALAKLGEPDESLPPDVKGPGGKR